MTWRGVCGAIALSPFVVIIACGAITAVHQWLSLPWPQMLLGAGVLVWAVATAFWLLTRD